MCIKFGEISESKIYYHPKTRKHLGIGKIVFKLTKSAKDCVQGLHQTTKMGTVMNVFLDTLGKLITKIE
jgi:histone-lysine N-methyltransferase SETD1